VLFYIYIAQTTDTPKTPNNPQQPTADTHEYIKEINNTMSRQPLTQETKDKISASWTDERREELSRRMKWRLANDTAFVERLRDGVTGKPKSDIQKYNMRLAKLDVPKSPEHRESMKKAHQLRYAILKQIIIDEKCTRKQAFVKLRENKDHYYTLYGDINGNT